MKPLFWDLSKLDNLARNNFSITEEIMMEHAALGIKEQIAKRFAKGSSVLIATGSGNNGADGHVLARLLDGYDVEILEVMKPKSEACKLQKLRSEKLNTPFIKSPKPSYAVVVDAIFGSGLTKELDSKTAQTIQELNSISAFKIACDFPSGLAKDGCSAGVIFTAQLTVAMGSANIGLFSDLAKNYCGEIIVATLGIGSKQYLGDETPDALLLEESDLKLPIRSVNATHKGSYGHLAVFIGDKEGAGILCGLSALGFGTGVVTLISKEKINTPAELMQDRQTPKNITAVAIGSGLGSGLNSSELKAIASQEMPFVLDADMFYKCEVVDFFDKAPVLTPHPKEFASLLGICGFGEFTAEKVQQNRFELAKKFSLKYQETVLVLKGANTIIAYQGKIFICALGCVALAKAGSGDVLAGAIAALLAQGYAPLEAATSAVLAHALASKEFKNNYALTPIKLIEKIKEL